ncbi:Bax inhibitor-1/YccA family protein [Zavarzinia sp.]|uniref:Bax inhibitor-1/YccA family protein n=1 Tax=Zavarzinia sp. TaxID=2027920 RepID=UPI0035617CE0
MADNYRYPNGALSGSRASAVSFDAGLRVYMQRVYQFMMLATGLSGVTAWLVANTAVRDIFFAYNPTAMAWGPTGLGIVAMIAPVVLVFVMGFRMHSMSAAAAQGTFWVYAGLTGLSLASILLNFTGESVARVFFITAISFGGMSLWGYTTKRNLDGVGSFLFMGLIGILVASVVNIFLMSSAMQWVISVIGVVVFAGLTAYDTQKIKEMYAADDDGEVMTKKAVFGALRLYLDFINLFIMLIQLFGQRDR